MYLIDNFNINTTLKNNEGLYFFNYILNINEVEKVVEETKQGMTQVPEIRLSKILNNYRKIIVQFKPLMLETIDFENQKFEQVRKIITNEDFKKLSNYNMIGITLEEEIKNIEKILQYFLMIKKINSNKIKKFNVKKNKI